MTRWLLVVVCAALVLGCCAAVYFSLLLFPEPYNIIFMLLFMVLGAQAGTPLGLAVFYAMQKD